MTSHARTSTGAPVDSLQGLYGLALLALLALLPVTALIGVASGDAPPWLLWAITSAVGVVATFGVAYRRIQPIPPGAIRLYRRVVMKRLGISLAPALVGATLYLFAGHWSAVVVGVLWAIPGMASSSPSTADYERHQDLWDERLPMPAAPMWGTADPNAIPPWEDPDGGHGHGIGHHGLH